jgi:membrane protease YdiL (CAAX protease family)
MMVNELSAGRNIKPMPLWQSVLLFGIPAIIFYLITHYGISRLAEITGVPFILSWFLLGGFFIFIPLFVSALIAADSEGDHRSMAILLSRLRLKPMQRADWLWTVGAIIFIAAATGVIWFAATWLSELTAVVPTPSPELLFMEFHGFGEGQSWLFIVWVPFFFFNIVGEELMWRGYILPRQEATHGKWAWFVNFLLWTGFHACFGLGMVIILLPILALVPLVVQKRKNTWIGIILHAVFNGPAFIAIASGGISLNGP